MTPKKIFNYLSYLQYPLLPAAFYFIYEPYSLLLQGQLEKENIEFFFQSLNNTLVVLGLAVSFSSLQDANKPQHKLAKWVFGNPKRSRVFIIFMITTALALLSMGSFGFFIINEGPIHQLSLGLIVLSIGYLGLIKAATEMAEKQNKNEDQPS